MSLCSQNNLDSTIGTGCDFDEDRVWTDSTEANPNGEKKAEPLTLMPGPVIQTQAPTPPPTHDPDGYKYCAHEGETCTCRGHVVYGKRYLHGKPGHGERETYAKIKGSGDYKLKLSYGEIACTNNVFGDPLYGFYKQCFCKTDLKIVPTATPTVAAPPPPKKLPALVKSPVAAASGGHVKFYSSPAFISVMCAVGVTGLGGLVLLAWRAYTGDTAKVGDTRYQPVNTE